MEKKSESSIGGGALSCVRCPVVLLLVNGAFPAFMNCR
jgi:hypothetical protein